MQNGRYTTIASPNEIPYPITLFMIVLPRAFGLVTKEVRIMNVVETGIFILVKIKRTMVQAVCK